jgi:hypothetical protein
MLFFQIKYKLNLNHYHRSFGEIVKIILKSKLLIYSKRRKNKFVITSYVGEWNEQKNTYSKYLRIG